jgi:hypothetical protein
MCITCILSLTHLPLMLWRQRHVLFLYSDCRLEAWLREYTSFVNEMEAGRQKGDDDPADKLSASEFKHPFLPAGLLHRPTDPLDAFIISAGVNELRDESVKESPAARATAWLNAVLCLIDKVDEGKWTLKSRTKESYDKAKDKLDRVLSISTHDINEFIGKHCKAALNYSASRHGASEEKKFDEFQVDSEALRKVSAAAAHIRISATWNQRGALAAITRTH